MRSGVIRVQLGPWIYRKSERNLEVIIGITSIYCCLLAVILAFVYPLTDKNSISGQKEIDSKEIRLDNQRHLN